MSERPTQEQIARGIDRADPIENADVILAAEVRALRGILARVEGLLFTTAFGRSRPEALRDEQSISARALRAALRGEL